MKIKYLGIMFVILLYGCATTANYEKILDKWVGLHVDNLISSWGPPRSSYKLSDGSEVIEFVNSRNAQMGGHVYSEPETTYFSGASSELGDYSGTSTTYVYRKDPIYHKQMYCKTLFTVNPKGVIAKWSWQGDDCKALSPK